MASSHEREWRADLMVGFGEELLVRMAGKGGED